ncbi:MAG: hypothetical protein PWR01_2056 [Clostridiales bacterium]|jgi:hypothetical protein|nr:hypothetical protein [Clostridiales bacterium]MDN5280983.1 hypothetical protein [Candidatus Ozemobacter sp.]
MRRNLLKIGIMAFLLASTVAYASPKGDMQFLGFSDEIISDVMESINENDEYADEEEAIDAAIAANPANEEADEATYLQEQLVELANTRSIRADLSDRSEEIKEKIDGYWTRMNPPSSEPGLSDELRSQILAGMREALALNGYTIVQLELLDLPEGSVQDRFRAVVRVTKPLKTRNSYKEIQQNLVEIKQICNQAATIEGRAYLSELTTFVAENPRNKYYYEKTILKY